MPNSCSQVRAMALTSLSRHRQDNVATACDGLQPSWSQRPAVAAVGILVSLVVQPASGPAAVGVDVPTARMWSLPWHHQTTMPPETTSTSTSPQPNTGCGAAMLGSVHPGWNFCECLLSYATITYQVGTVESKTTENNASSSTSTSWGHKFLGKVAPTITLPAFLNKLKVTASIGGEVSKQSTSTSGVANATAETHKSTASATVKKFFPERNGQRCLWQWAQRYGSTSVLLTEDWARTESRGVPPRCLPGCALDLDKTFGSLYQLCADPSRCP